MELFVKLSKNMLWSTIWRESDQTRLVWITMLMLADKDGLVHASIPGLADAAKVSIDECEIALERLSAVDKYSRTQDYDGRRIETIDGGWRLLNYVKYRGQAKEDRIREQTRDRVAKHRAAQREIKREQEQASTCNASNAHIDIDRDIYITPPTPPMGGTRTRTRNAGYSDDFEKFWQYYPKKVGKGDAWKRWKAASLPPLQTIIGAVIRQKESIQWRKDGGQYIPNPSTWINQCRWDDDTCVTVTPYVEPKTIAEKNEAYLRKELMHGYERDNKQNTGGNGRGLLIEGTVERYYDDSVDDLPF